MKILSALLQLKTSQNIKTQIIITRIGWVTIRYLHRRWPSPSTRYSHFRSHCHCFFSTRRELNRKVNHSFMVLFINLKLRLLGPISSSCVSCARPHGPTLTSNYAEQVTYTHFIPIIRSKVTVSKSQSKPVWQAGCVGCMWLLSSSIFSCTFFLCIFCQSQFCLLCFMGFYLK